jgi:YD repeat-containing protein
VQEESSGSSAAAMAKIIGRSNMVAIVSGNSLGLNQTSAGVLGAQGLYGNPRTGQGGEQAYVNASTGNLVMQQVQDTLAAAGLDVSSVLTYNSLGLRNDDNGDNFSLGKVPAQLSFTGTPGAIGSTITRTAFDGSQIVFTRGNMAISYISVNATGAQDTITPFNSSYTFLDGSTQSTEVYDSTGVLQSRSDAAGNTITFGYTDGQMTSVTDANGEAVTYVYSGTLLQQIKAPVTTWVGGVPTTSVQPIVTYGYDGSNRLASVTVDLMADGSTADGKVYTTAFTYDGTSTRVQTVSQSDGTKLTFAYDGSNRVYTITDALNNVTTFAYDTTNRKTSVAANGQTTVYTYDANGQLLSVAAPAVNGVTPTTQFAYNAQGKAVSTTDPDGRITSMAYDTAGNLVSILTPAGQLTTRAYDKKNRLVSETKTMSATPALVATSGMVVDGGNVAKTGSATAWDSAVRSQTGIPGGPATASFTASSTGGQLMVGLNSDPDLNASYTSIDYALYLDAGTLQVYANGTQVMASIGTYVGGDRLGVSYDGNGHVNFLKNGQTLYTLAASPTQPLYLDSSFFVPGSAVLNLAFSSSLPEASMINSWVNTAGMAIFSNAIIKTASTTAWDAGVRSVAGYSGLATVSLTAPVASDHLMFGLNSDPNTDASYTSIDYALYLNAGVLSAYANGNVVTTSLGSYVQGDQLAVSYDGNGHVNFLKNGQIIYSMAATPTQPLYGDTSFYDRNYQVLNLSFVGDTGLTTRYVYSADGKGLLRYMISPAGNVTEYGYNALGQLTSTNQYTQAVYLAYGTTAADAPTEAVMNAWRGSQNLALTQRTDISRDSRQQIASTTTYQATAADGTGIASGASMTTFVYDPSGRLLQTVKPGSATSTFAYDGLGRITSTTDALHRTTTTSYADATGTITVTCANQLVSTSTFDKDGRLTSTTNAYSGSTLSKGTVDYDSLGRVLRSTDLTGVSTWYLYDADGRKVAAIDGNGAMTEYVYDNAGFVTKTITYAAPVNLASFVDGNGKPNNPPINAVRPAFNAATDQRSWTVYDAAGRLSQTISATGTVTQYDYDSDDRLISTCTFATTVAVSSLGSAASFQFVAPSANDRVSRNFYDADGRLVGMLDADNFLTVCQYDGAGQRTVTTAYATASPAATDQSTLAQLVPSSAAGDRRSVTLYDMQGRITGSIDPLGYLTQTVYNPRNTIDHVTRYATSVGTAVASGTLVDTVKPAPSAGDATTSFVYDADDRVTSQTDAAGIITTYTYDPKTDALVSSTTGSGRTDATATQMRYDALGRAVAALDATGSALITSGMTQAQIDAVWTAHATTTTYDLAGRRTSVKDALGNRTLYFYDRDGRLRYTVDPLNNVQEQRYDPFGNVTATVAYATPVNPTSIGAGGLVTTGLTAAVAAVANGAKDRLSSHVYDTAGHLTLSVDPSGAATSYVYDANGNVRQETQYATLIASGSSRSSPPAADSASDRTITYTRDADGRVLAVSGPLPEMVQRNVYDALGQLIYTVAGDGAVTRTDHDADGRVILTTTYANKVSTSGLPLAATAGQVLALIVAKPGSDALLAVQYDALGRVRFSMDGTGAVTERRYDADGNVVDAITYANKIAVSAWNATTPPTVVADAARDRHIHASYDARGNLIAQSDGTGAVVINTYDADNRVTDRVSYANRIAAGSWTSGASPTVSADSTRDIHERYVYDVLGRLTYSADGTGAVTAYVYDAAGNLKQKTSLATRAADGQALNTVAVNASDRVEQFSYDSFGRQVWHSNAEGALDFTSYDADGRVAQSIQYAQLHPGTLPAGTAPLATSAADRLTAVYYTPFGQTSYTVDALGRVTLEVYDRGGRLSSMTKYAGTIAVGTVPSTSNVPVDGAHDEQTSYKYDAAGRLQQRTDAMGGVQAFTYDGLGNKLTLTDEKSQLWNWTYDADGRELTQTAPPVSVTTNAINGSGDLADSSSNVRIVAFMAYDGTGNLTQRTDGYGRSDSRTTVYGYDAAGRRVSVQGPAFNSYDYHGNLVSANAPVARVLYDAFGNVVATVDALNAITYNTYDQANRLAFSVDPLGYVTGNVRDAFGDVLVQTKYGAQSSLIGAVPTKSTDAPTNSAVASAVGALAHTSDRATTFSYDAVGRLKSRVGTSGYFYDATSGFASNAAETAAAPRTNFWYDAFGDMVLQEELVNQTQALYAQTYRYYDTVGQQTDTVDAMGYQTHRTFDSFGNVTQMVEYANAKTGSWSVSAIGAAPTASTTDRATTSQYDRLNRKTSETRLLDYSLSDDGVISGHSVTSTWGYDAQGHVTRATDANGATTYREYDALGRLRSEISPARSSTVDGSTITPVTEYAYDAFGAVSMKSERFNSATAVTEFTGAWSSGGANGYSVAASTNDLVTRSLYDHAGNAIQLDDPMAATSSFHNTFNYYNANGKLAYTKHLNAGNDGVNYVVYSGNQYDAAGQLVHAYAPSTDSTQAAHDISTDYQYNAFGDVIKKGINGGWQESFDYNAAGQLWRTNTSGVTTAYLHDLQGHVTGTLTSQGHGHGDVDLSSVDPLSAAPENAVLALGNLRSSYTVYDKLGRSVQVVDTGRNAVSGGISVISGTTRWSNVTTVSTPVGTVIVERVDFPDVSQLGTGEMKFDVSYWTDHGSAKATFYFTQNLTTTVTFGIQLAPGEVMGGISSILASKKNTTGDWVALNAQSPENQSLVRTQVLVAAPDDPSSTVSFSYNLPGNQPIAVGLTNFGGSYWFDAGTAPSSTTYLCSATVTTLGGTATTTNGSFTTGSTQTVSSATNNWITPKTIKTYDRWGNLLTQTDPRWAGWVHTYQYNANNQVILDQQPDPAGTAAAGPVTQSFYDRVGNLVAVLDPRSTVSSKIINGKRYDAAGRVARVDNADGTHTVNQYDVFGRLAQSIAANGFDDSGNALANVADYTTRYTYDLEDDVLSVQHGTGSGNVNVWTSTTGDIASLAAVSQGAQNLQQVYTYDADGNRLSSWDGLLAADNVTREITYYKYDAAGRLIQTTEPLLAGQTAATANSTSTNYDDFGHKKSETDENGRTATWQYDYFGVELLAHTDLGGTTYAYSYDNDRQLYAETSSRGLNVTYSFDAAGNMTQASDIPDNKVTTYVYDAANRHLAEKTQISGTVYQDNHMAYDAMGRLVDSSDGSVHVWYQYDAADNRTLVGSHVIMDGAMGAMKPTGYNGFEAGQTRSRYYAYDAMNRVLHAEWDSATGAGDSGHTLTYDHDGNRKSDSYYGVVVSTTQTSTGTDAYGDPIFGSAPSSAISSTMGTVVESYTYDADDRLTVTKRDGIFLDNRLYDVAGRIIMEGSNGGLPTGYEYTVDHFPGGAMPSLKQVDVSTRFNRFDAHGNLVAQRSGPASTIDNSAFYESGVQTRGFDAAGNLLGSLATYGADTVTTKVTRFDIGESYKTAVETTVSTKSGGLSGTATTTYDKNDQISWISTGSTNRTFYTDIGGQVLQAIAPNYDRRNVIINGEVMGNYGLAYDSSNDITKIVSQYPSGDFEFGYQGISDSSTAAAVGTYKVQQGDTLQSIAFRVYGDAALWRKIALANGLQDDNGLKVGQTITIPSASGSESHNNLHTFTPYQPWKIINSAPELSSDVALSQAVQQTQVNSRKTIMPVHGFRDTASGSGQGSNAVSAAVVSGGSHSPIMDQAAINARISADIEAEITAEMDSRTRTAPSITPSTPTFGQQSWQAIIDSDSELSAAIAQQAAAQQSFQTAEHLQENAVGALSGLGSTTMAGASLGQFEAVALAAGSSSLSGALAYVAAPASYGDFETVVGNAGGGGPMGGYSSYSGVSTSDLTPQGLQVGDMSGVLPGPINVAGAVRSTGDVPSQGRWIYNVNGQAREQPVDENQPWHPDGVLGPAVELPPINNGNPTIANAIAHGFAVEGVPDASRSALIAAASLGGEFSVLDASLPADIATGSAGPAGAAVRDPVNAVLGFGGSLYNGTIGGLAANSVRGGAYLLAGDYLQSYSMGNGGLEEAQQIMAMGDTHASLILAHPQGEGGVVGAAMGNSVLAMSGAASIVQGGVGLYNDWQVGRTLAGFSNTELQALRTVGMSDPEIARSVAVNGDVYLFRGTSPGWPGSPGAQATAVSAAVDPYAATVFALEARGQSGQAVVQFGARTDIGTFSEGQWAAVQEREVGVQMNSQQFAQNAPYSVPVDAARQALADMGLPELPHSIWNPNERSDFLDAVPRLTPNQIADFLSRVAPIATKPKVGP